jgi:TPR repeat protein
LGWRYKYGEGVKKDLAKAVEWLRQAAEQGYAPAQNALGFCYEFGDGVEKDLKKAIEWYTKAAEQGDARAQNNLALCIKELEGKK